MKGVVTTLGETAWSYILHYYYFSIICKEAYIIHMNDLQENISATDYILNELKKGLQKDKIHAGLLEKGYEDRFATELLQETAKLHYNTLRAQGLKLILIGAFICFISCLLTLTSSITHINSQLVLYGFTSLGIIIIFVGLMKIF